MVEPHASATMLVRVSGPDRPGVTARLLGALAPHNLSVLDIEQVVIRGVLVLGLLLDASDASDEHRTAAQTAVCRTAGDLGLDCTVTWGADEADDRRHGRLLVTVIGSPLCPDSLSQVVEQLAGASANVDRITRVAAYPVTALELEVSGADTDTLRSVLATVGELADIDVAVQRPGLHRRGARLVVMDVDSTFIQQEVIDLIASEAGCEEQVAAVTAAAMQGDIPFAESLRRRVALLEGTPASVLETVRSRVSLTPGARTLCRTLRALGFHVALVSGGFHEVIDPLAAELGVEDVRANRLEVVDGFLTGRTQGPVIDRAAKAAALRELAEMYGVPLDHTVAIGDGANDLDMLATAGLGIAFNAKPIVRQQAHAAVNFPYLDSVLYLLGIPREEIDEYSHRENG